MNVEEARKNAGRMVMTPKSAGMTREMPTHSTEEIPYYYIHKPEDLMCECEWSQIWLSWPLECRNCGRVVRSTLKAPLHTPSNSDEN